MFKKYLPTILLFVCWLFLHYRFGNRTYGLLVLAALLLIATLRGKNLPIVLATAGLILLLLSPIADTLNALRGYVIDFVNRKERVLHDIFTPRAGLDALPVQVREELSLLQEHELDDYRLYKTLENDPLLHQRIVEAAWPARRDPLSHHVFAIVEETRDLLPACTEIGRKDHVVLYYCP
jgi:hypothetical protein